MPSAPIPHLDLSNILILILILKIWNRAKREKKCHPSGTGTGTKANIIIQPCLYGDSIDRLGNLKPAFTLGIQFIQFRALTSLTSRCDGVKLGRAGRKMASLLLASLQPAPSRSSLNPSYYADFLCPTSSSCCCFFFFFFFFFFFLNLFYLWVMARSVRKRYCNLPISSLRLRLDAFSTVAHFSFPARLFTSMNATFSHFYKRAWYGKLQPIRWFNFNCYQIIQLMRFRYFKEEAH